MSARNPGTEFDLSWISKIQVNQPAVLRRAEQIQARRTVKKEWQAAWLLKAVTFIDLTTLSGDDTPSSVQRLCYKARYPIREDLLKALNMHDKGITTAAVCVYPARVGDAVKALKAAACNIPVASVATGFPAGQTHLKTRLEEIRLAVEDGATEIDVVINRTLVLTGQWEALYDEIRQFRKACGEAHLKTILATGELGSLTNVYKASMIAMMAAVFTCAVSSVTLNRFVMLFSHRHEPSSNFSNTLSRTAVSPKHGKQKFLVFQIIKNKVALFRKNI
ncbi:deoxyribose-phosphate aldolase isoform X2 [Loxodonta africana]|uniref:deoxyribose-phosphate aldolase isoform X2 n=1 Tax=Loxodonta africana TaxID=9785 RepID=UPI0030CAF1DB